MRFTASVQSFAKLFVKRQDQFKNLCEYILNTCTGMDLPEEVSLYNALFELYLAPTFGGEHGDGLGSMGSTEERGSNRAAGQQPGERQESMETRRKKAYDLLQRGWADEVKYRKYVPEHVLMLARMHEWVEG